MPFQQSYPIILYTIISYQEQVHSSFTRGLPQGGPMRSLGNTIVPKLRVYVIVIWSEPRQVSLQHPVAYKRKALRTFSSFLNSWIRTNG